MDWAQRLSCIPFVFARPIIYEMPEAAVIFLLFMGIASIVLFNLMTAIVVKNAFDASEADEALHCPHKFFPKLNQ